MTKRLFFLNLFFLFLIAVLIVRFFSLQVLSYDFFEQRARNQHQLSKTLAPSRGKIFVRESRNGELLPVVTNIQKSLVFAVPQEIADPGQTARQLARILEMSEADILGKLADPERKWVPLKKELPENTAMAVEQLKLPGIYLEPETLRFYPEKTFASQVLGFVGFESDRRSGQYGIEAQFERELQGRPGYLSLERDTRGRWITGGFRDLIPAENGADVVLTLDRAIQFKAEEILAATASKHQADSGSMIVMEGGTGAILAMANWPSFDPNIYGQVNDIGVFRNNAISATYEPGSVFKPITMAAALEAGVVEPDTTYEDKGVVVVDQYTITNSDQKAHGRQTMTQVLEQSLNTGIVFVQDRLGPEKFLATVKKFGFGSATGIELPAEAAGNIQNLIGGGDAHYATASFGQGITVTLLQLAQAFATIVNEGKLVVPNMVQELRMSDGRVERPAPPPREEVISARTAHTLAAMLVSVVENGHGKRAGVPGYYLAGKTGTAQVARSDQVGYDPNVTIGTFVGAGPISDLKFVIAVKVDNPKTVRFAESTAAPAFGEMAQYLMNYFQIPPTRP